MVTDSFWQYLPTTIAALAAGAAVVIGALARRDVQIASSKVDATSEKVDKLHIAVDGRLTQLLERTAIASHATGVQEGIDKNLMTNNKEGGT